MQQVIQDAVQDISRVQSVMGYLKAVFGAIGMIGVGAMIAFFAPDDLREEIPIYRELGVGFMVIGGLFALALFANSGPGSVGQRAKSFLISVVFGVFAFGFGVSQWGPYGSVGYVMSVLVGLLSLFAFWEVITGRPDVTSDP